MTLDVRWADSDGVAIAHRTVGEGPRDLVIVPGLYSHLEIMWEHPATERFLRRLSSFARVILWDKREQGLSDRLGRPPTLEESMGDLRAVLDAVGAERPTLLGSSEGGPMVSLFAATHPDRLDRLILYGTWARLTQAPDHPAGFPPETLAGFARLVRDRWASRKLLRLFAPTAIEADPDVVEWGRRLMRSSCSPGGAASLMQLYLDIDTRDVLPAITVPTLVLHRSGDLIAPVAHGRDLAARIPGARYAEHPGDDHLPWFGDADALTDEIEEFVTGSRRERDADRVLATVLFTDICGSTERAAALGDRRWRDLLEAHDRAVRREVERRGGRLVKSMGDGALATFAGPARGIEAAQAIRDAVAALGVESRAGLHTGECEVLGDDVGGLAVHIGARVAATAAPGEVRVSRTVTDLVAGSGLRFTDRGDHELKGVPGRWQLFAVDGRD